MKKNNKILCLMLSLIMAMSLVPTVALAASAENCPGSCTHEAEIGTTHYATLKEAVDAAKNGNTITLVGDKDTYVEEMVTIPVGKEITIDLNGREIYVYDEETETNHYGITNYGKLTLKDSDSDKDGYAWRIDNYGELTINGGNIYVLTNNTSGEVVINDGFLDYPKGDGSYSVNGGMFLRYPPLDYVDENDIVVEVDVYVELSQYINPWVHYYAVNDSIEVYESDMAYVDRVKEGNASYAKFNILNAPNGAELNIDNLHPDLLINNETDSAVILNGHLLGAGVKGKKLAELPAVYKISVTNGTVRIGGVEKYNASEGETVQLNASGAPNGQEFDKWEITGLNTSGMDLTRGELTFAMPAADVAAKATYKDAALPPAVKITEGNCQEWTKGTVTGISFKSTADYDNFTQVEVDGILVAAENYTVASGSTIVTLNASYLETLPVGGHTIVIQSANDRPEALFTIKDGGSTHTHSGGNWKSDGIKHWKECSCGAILEESAHVDKNNDNKCDTCGHNMLPVEVPKTGDDSNILLYGILMLAALAGIVGTTVISKREKA